MITNLGNFNVDNMYLTGIKHIEIRCKFFEIYIIIAHS